MFKDYKTESRKKWGQEQGDSLSKEQIQLDAILRIADATEIMAKNYDSLVRDRDYYKRRCEAQS